MTAVRGVPVPPRTALVAETDQALARTRDLRVRLAVAGSQGELLLMLGEGVAGPLRAQFPGVPAGRVLMAAVECLIAVVGEFADRGIDDVDSVLGVAGLAAEQLDREAPHG